jgi:hypothetical protein
VGSAISPERASIAIPLFGQSIARAPGLIIGLLFVSAYMAAGIDRAPLKWQFAYAFVAGGVGFYFDLLNGDILAVLILFSLVRLISILAFDPPTVPSPFTRLPTSAAVAHIMAGFVTGAVSMAVWRIVLRAMLTGQSLFAALAEWRAQLSKFSTDIRRRRAGRVRLARVGSTARFCRDTILVGRRGRDR